jgi:hypothetical protein
MVRVKRSSSKLISNLSVSLIESAFLILVENALSVYRHNINWQRPPVAGKENVNAAAAIVMLVTGLDYHLCRLKYLRDIAIHKPPLPHTPYFNWNFDDAFSKKLRCLLIQRKEARLLNELIEITVCRDSIVHPKVYTITHSWDADLNDRFLKAKLAPGAILRDKALKHKMRRKDFMKLLKLPLVPTWVSYVDAVACILVVHRLLNQLEWRYGNPYAWVGGITAYENQTKELFTGWNWQYSHPRELQEWVTAFFQTLSPQHQSYVKRRLGGYIEPHLLKKQQRGPLRKSGKRSLEDIFRIPQAPMPDFLSKPPPWKM